MNKALLFAFFVVTFVCRPTFAGEPDNPANQLNVLITKINADIQTGKKTEADFSDDFKQLEAFRAAHKSEKTDIAAFALYNEALLYSDVGNDNKADALITQLKHDFKDTPLVNEIEKEEAQAAAAQKIRDSLASGTQFPRFSEKDVEGKPLSVDNYRGKVVLIDFWATWCVPCRIELPYVIDTYKKYHDRGLEVIGVSLDTDP
jgi:thioredoxin-like negative regulator of GroEL